MFSPGTKNYPPSFAPLPPESSGSKGSSWLFTRTWRMRRLLAQAYQTREDAQAAQALESSYKHLADASELETIADSTIEETLLFLVWAKLRQQSLQEAVSWLEELDKQRPNLPAAAALRWQLMGKLLEAGDITAYLDQCRLFLSSPLIDFEKYGQAVLDAIGTVYEKASPSDCAAVIAAAHPGLQGNEVVRGCLELSRCPNVFASPEDARSWADRIDPDLITFSSVMRSDALLVRARAAESAHDLRSMYMHSVAAIVEKPDHLPAFYWMVRTKLYASDADPTAGLDLQGVPNTTNWQRLIRLTGLYRQPTFENSAEFVPWLEDSENPLDLSEKTLTITLLKKALTISPNWGSEEIAQCSQLCDRIERAVGRQPWTQLNIAIQEIRWEGRYASAVERLENDDVIKESQAPTLARIARILAGAPKFGSNKDDEECLWAIENAMERLLSKSAGKSLHDEPELLEQLEQAREDRLCEEFPALAVAADVLRFAVGVLMGSEPAQSLTAISDFTPSSPLWAVWLNARAFVVQAMSAGLVPPETLDRTSEIVAWDFGRWAALYGNRVGEAPSSVSMPKGWSLRDLGELCESLCLAEMSFESDYVSMRSSLRSAGFGESRFEDALNNLEKLTEALDRLPPASRAWWLPEIVYWRGVAQTRFDSQAAKTLLESLVLGPKSLAARAQLALLAIKQRDLDAADRWIAQEAVEHPATMYAQSLLLIRRGRDEEAHGLLKRFETTFDSTSSPYVPACGRLLAAIAERSGEPEQAERLHRATLAACPSDPITSARLGRMLFRRAYENGDTRSFSENHELARLLKDAFEHTCTPVGWSGSLLSLYRLLIAPEKEIDAEIAKIETEDWSKPATGALSQILIQRLLELRRAGAAWELVEKRVGSIDSPRLQRTAFILKSWRNLTTLWKTYQPPDWQAMEAELAQIRAERGPDLDGETMWRLAEERARHQALDASISREALQASSSCLQEIEAFGCDETDEALRRWLFLLRRASELSNGNDLDLTPELWSHLEPWIIGILPGLFAEEETDRIRVAQALAKGLSREDNLDIEQRRLLEAISAHGAEQEDAFLDAYDELEPVLDLLPVDAASAWLAAAHIRFRRKIWTPIIEGKLPDSIADLSNPRVRLVVGLAHVRSAVDDILKDSVREAQKKVRQARNMLAPLLEGETDGN